MRNPRSIGFQPVREIIPVAVRTGLKPMLLVLLLATSAVAQVPTIREIFVPLDDLNVVLESETQRAFLTRKEYDELLAKAKTSAEKLAPIANAVTSAAYQAKL